MPGVESAEREDFDDGEAGRVTAAKFPETTKRPVADDAAWPVFICRLSLSAKNLPKLAIDLGGILGGFRDQLDPLVSRRRHFQLAKQVGSLHDGFDGIAEVVNQFAQLVGNVGRKFLRVGHGASRA
jgi:hypothetical protein